MTALSGSPRPQLRRCVVRVPYVFNLVLGFFFAEPDCCMTQNAQHCYWKKSVSHNLIPFSQHAALRERDPLALCTGSTAEVKLVLLQIGNRGNQWMPNLPRSIKNAVQQVAMA